MRNSCSCCGNVYDQLMKISYQGRTHFFDSFECAIQVLAPICISCGVKVIGHGVESDSSIFCSAHCARSSGKVGVIDHSESMLSSNKVL